MHPALNVQIRESILSWVALCGLAVLLAACGSLGTFASDSSLDVRRQGPAVYLWCEDPSADPCARATEVLGVDVVGADALPAGLVTDLGDREDDCLDPAMLVVLQPLLEALAIAPRNMHDNAGGEISDAVSPYSGPGCTNCCWNAAEVPLKMHRGQVEGQPAFLVRVWKMRGEAAPTVPSEPLASGIHHGVFLWCAAPEAPGCAKAAEALGVEPTPVDDIPRAMLLELPDRADDCADFTVLATMRVLRDALALDPSQWHDNGGDMVTNLAETFAGPGCTNCCWDPTEPAVKVHRNLEGQMLVRVWPPSEPAEPTADGREASLTRSSRGACPSGRR